MDVSKLLVEMLQIPSESGKEAELALMLAKRLRENFKIRLQKVGGGFNLFAYVGNPEIVLNTHLDTVPGQLKVWKDGRYIYGRGACDAKGIAAAIIVAAEKARGEGFTDFGLLFDVCEETDFSGVKKAMTLIQPKLLVIGEPTMMKIVNGQKGLLQIRIKSFGVAAHSSNTRALSAISGLLDAINMIRSMDLSKNAALGQTTCNVGTINGGTAPNVVAEYAEAQIEFRTAVPNRKLLRKLDRILGKKITYEIELDYDPVFSDWQPDIKGVGRTLVVPYFTELFFYKDRTRAIILGPGDYRLAHSKKEKIGIRELDSAVRLYLRLIRRYGSTHVL